MASTPGGGVQLRWFVYTSGTSWIQVTYKFVRVHNGSCILNHSRNQGQQVHLEHALVIYFLEATWKILIIFLVQIIWKCAFKIVSTCCAWDQHEETVVADLKGVCKKCIFWDAIHPLQRNYFAASRRKCLQFCLIKSTSDVWLTVNINFWVFSQSKMLTMWFHSLIWIATYIPHLGKAVTGNCILYMFNQHNPLITWPCYLFWAPIGLRSE